MTEAQRTEIERLTAMLAGREEALNRAAQAMDGYIAALAKIAKKNYHCCGAAEVAIEALPPHFRPGASHEK